jgi:hypothetical protein
MTEEILYENIHELFLFCFKPHMKFSSCVLHVLPAVCFTIKLCEYEFVTIMQHEYRKALMFGVTGASNGL